MNNKGIVYTSYFSKADKIEDAYKVAIVQWLPSFIIAERKIYNTKEPKHYVHLPEFAPNEQMLMKYKEGKIPFEELIAHTEKHLDEEIEKGAKVKYLIDNFCRLLDEGENIAFVCYEKDYNNCHRKVIGDLFKKIGYNIIEF